MPTRNSSCLRPTHVTPRFALRKWGHSGQHGLGFAVEHWQRSAWMASFGSGLVRTAPTINLDKHRDERHSVVTRSSIQAPTPRNPRFNQRSTTRQLRKGRGSHGALRSPLSTFSRYSTTSSSCVPSPSTLPLAMRPRPSSSPALPRRMRVVRRRPNYSVTTSICLSITCPANRSIATCTQYRCSPSTTKSF